MQIKTTLRFYLTPQLDWLASRTLSMTNVGEDAGKKEPSYTADGNVKVVQPLWKTIWRLLKNLLIDLP
jgi:hypothetical protein